MALFPDPSRPTAFEGFQGQDGSWDDSVSMQRSDSQSTTCTVDSSYTTGTVFSGCSSVTDYSSIDPALTEEGTYGEILSYPDPCSFYEAPDAAQMLSATGSQYQQSGHLLPQALHLTSHLQQFSTQPGIEDAAWHATLAAKSLTASRLSFEDGGTSFITSEAVEEALQSYHGHGAEEPVRPAVQEVLYQQLQPRFGDVDHFYTDITMILEEAAYQLQSRLQGPEVLEICFYAIVTVLAKLMGGDTEADDNTGGSSGSVDLDTPSSSPVQTIAEKDKFICHYSGCQKGASRQADLERHFRIVHLDDDKKKKYPCDYKKCGRHAAPFFRQDHFRDHLRIYHKEDLLRRGNKGDEEWWATRAPRALNNGWWRCSRCLARVGLDKSGFVCAGCGNPCEKERQQYRTAAMAMADAEFRR
ncbi:hypothetical protein C8A00DRAFT_14691 [Chaetomidium leptoderma]|uniref:C2H2-type domain-containing protein n=1 Tax=Chaetomidium leptoderma TaxID=669021 RepID=A0AAN6VM88_9PEZI|nr:hypothetical protein C8A00DRAFT_14691 [Chaetomidium leptoderma]